MKLHTPVAFTYTPAAKHASLQAGLLLVGLAGLLTVTVLALGDWRVPLPIRGLADLSVWLLYAVPAGVLLNALRAAWHLHRHTTSRLYKVRPIIPISDFGDIHGSGALAAALHTWAPHLIPPRT